MSINKIIDQNYLRLSKSDNKLEEFLLNGNNGLITELNFYESTRGNGLINLRRSFEIISKYPNNIYFLKSMDEIIKLTNKKCVDPIDLIDQLSNSEKQNIFNDIYSNDYQVEKNTEYANIWFAQRENIAEDVISNLKLIKKKYSKKMLQEIKTWDVCSEETKKIIISEALEQSYRYTADCLKSNDFYANSFLFRFSIATILLQINWINKALFNITNKKIVLSNLLDATYYTLGTYFNGCLTNDILSNKIYKEMDDCLKLCYTTENYKGKDF